MAEEQDGGLELKLGLLVQPRPDRFQGLLRAVSTSERAFGQGLKESSFVPRCRLGGKPSQNRVRTSVVTDQESAVGELIGVLVHARLDREGLLQLWQGIVRSALLQQDRSEVEACGRVIGIQFQCLLELLSRFR